MKSKNRRIEYSLRSGASFALFAVALLSSSITAISAPVDAASAAQRVATWRSTVNPPSHAKKFIATYGSKSASVGASSVVSGVSDDGTTLFHSVVFDDGWWAVAPADDSLPPVLAFADTGKPPSGPSDPAWKTISRIVAARNPDAGAGDAAREASNGGKTVVDCKVEPEESDFDVRVPVLCETRWGQDKTGGAAGRNCYNYYTPNNWPSGCIATAMAQLMRYWCFPEGELAQVANKCYVGGVETTMQFMDGPLDWDSMPLVPALGATTKQRRAIGKLLFYCGVSCCMRWEPETSTSSLWDMWWGLLYDFSYANAVFYGVYWDYFAKTPSPESIPTEDFSRILRSNLDAGCPVVVGIDSHAAVADGYGYSGSTLYTHLNFGWEGDCDGWFVLPDVDCGFYASSFADQVVYNVFPNYDKKFANGGELLTGRVTDSSGAPIAGATVSAIDEDGFAVPKTRTDERGIYALNLEGDLEYRVTAECAGYSAKTRTEFVPLAETLPVSDDGQYILWGTVGVGNCAGVDFTLESSGDVPGPSDGELSNVHRFYSKAYKGHFFTIDEEEAETVRTTNPNWRYEGIAYRASVSPRAGLVPLYRFWSKGYRSHFYTTSEEERDNLIATNPNWKYETEAFWVSPVQIEGTVPVYRFWSSGYKHHFYTIDEKEKDDLIATNPNWKYERIAFYAWP